MTTLVELCAGTAAVSLWALGRCSPLTGFMGNKRRWRDDLCSALGVLEARPDRVILVDAGPWGDVWTVLRTAEGRSAAAGWLDRWQRTDRDLLWRYLSERAPFADAAKRVAQYLWLQGRSAGTIPCWWNPEHVDADSGRVGRWESPSGGRTEALHERQGGACARARRQKGAGAILEASGSRHVGKLHAKSSRRSDRGRGCRGIQHPASIAARIRALERIDWSRVEVLHADVRSVEPFGDVVVYFDPPYRGCTRYAVTLPRAGVLAVARGWHAAGARVAVSEGEPLAELEGWTARRLAVGRTEAGGGGRVRREEWVTASWPFRLEEQLALPGVAA